MGRIESVSDQRFSTRWALLLSVLGIAVDSEPRGVRVEGNTAGISRRHCSVRRDGENVVVEDHSTYGTLLNGERVDGRAGLRAGDRLRLGHPGVQVQLVALVSDDGSP